ncbi:MAG: tRNA (adenosine(37)-N6)-dimethylallyltransferase MiaA [Flavobacteriaceae bacterium]|nr:tRNA (adenosine(37)-N6)-dimethylallyltransferase MiaA [Flavobacteriaceae bacterium]
MNKYLITIIGATSIGKTALSIELAKHFNTEIISSDSRQFYKEMTIGTATPNKEELNQVKHHFIQNRSIFDDYNVGDFERDAIVKLDTLFEKYSIIIMVGGSGLYTNAVLNGLDDFPDVNSEIRIQLKSNLQEKGILFLQNQLKKLDLETYQKIDLNNKQRLIRALEICIGTGKPFSSFLNNKKNKRNFIPIKIGLTAPRETIYSRINQRVELMMQNGLLQEAKKLYNNKYLNALQTVGYKELFSFFDGNSTLDFAVSEIKKNTRRFAKRQETWFKKDKEIEWFDYQYDVKQIVEYIKTVAKALLTKKYDAR